MVKAVRVHDYGGPEALSVDDIEIGAPGPGEVLVRQTAVGLNFIDTYHRSGLYKLDQLPHTLGVEGAGPGRAPEGRAAAFERVSRLHNAADHGCGLGLAIVREIAGRHGATVTLGDAQGGGLRVEVVFPIPDNRRDMT